MLRFPLFLLSVLLLPGATFAQDYKSEITFFAGGFLGDSFTIVDAPIFEDVEAIYDDEFTVGGRYAYYFHPNLALEFGLGFSPSAVVASGNVSGGSNAAAIFNVDAYVIHANILYRPVQGSIVPYVTAGVGGVHFDINTARHGFLTPSETDFAFNAGGGVKFRLHEEYFFRADARAYWMDPEFSEDDATFVEITGGISIFFDF